MECNPVGETKICIKCGIEKLISDYESYTSSWSGKRGIQNVCRKCNNERRKNWRKGKKADEYNKKRRERTANDPKYRETTRQYKIKYRTNNRERHLELARAGANRRYKENPEVRETAKRKSSIYSKKRYNECRQECIDKLGGKCVGYNKVCGETENLQFDHTNPLEKSLAISEALHWSPKKKKESKFYEELNKCQLLCPDCHLEKTKDEWLSGDLTMKLKCTQAKNRNKK
tara:strand:- start:50 stop:739 length:690 start_codon:yes stop_codon:yes gene_type:complete